MKNKEICCPNIILFQPNRISLTFFPVVIIILLNTLQIWHNGFSFSLYKVYISKTPKNRKCTGISNKLTCIH